MLEENKGRDHSHALRFLQEETNLQAEFEKRELVLQNKLLNSCITLIHLEGARWRSPMQTGQLSHPNSKATLVCCPGRRKKEQKGPEPSAGSVTRGSSEGRALPGVSYLEMGQCSLCGSAGHGVGKASSSPGPTWFKPVRRAGRLPGLGWPVVL